MSVDDHLVSSLTPPGYVVLVPQVEGLAFELDSLTRTGGAPTIVIDNAVNT